MATGQYTPYLLDINIAVYNHARFLRQTLDGVLSQKTTFAFRVLIGDDCSTDGSIDILKEYEARYSNVEVIYQSKNLGIGKGESNGKILLKNSTAKYLTLLDGDDYWTDVHKLQKQIDFLEKNPGFSITHHRVLLLRNEELVKDYLNQRTPFTTGIADLAQGNYIRTVSAIFRNHLTDPAFPYKIDDVTGDYYLYMATATRGKIKYFPEEMGVYRLHQGGIWSHHVAPSMRETWLTNLDKLGPLFSGEITHRLNKQYLEVAEALMQQYETAGNKEAARQLGEKVAKIKSSLPPAVLKEKKRERFTWKEKIKKWLGYGKQ